MSRQSQISGSVRGLVVLSMLLGVLLTAGPAPSDALAAESQPAVPCGPHVYYDIHHDSDGDADSYKDLADLIIGDLGGTFAVQDRSISTAALDGYNVLLILDPELAFDAAEMAAVANFVTGGGRLVILGEWGGQMNTATVNDLLTAVGVYISFNRDQVQDPSHNEGYSSWPLVHQFANHPLSDQVRVVALYSASSLNVARPAIALASGDDDSYTTVTAAEGLQDDNGPEVTGLGPQDIDPSAPIVMAYSWAGPGSVFAVGDSGLWEDGDADGDGTLNLDEFDHRQLARNVFDYPWCRQAGCHRILFDETHGWGYDPPTGNYTIEEGFAELAAFLRGHGHLVASLQDPGTLDLQTLRRYDVLVLLLPREPYSPAEEEAIARFVSDGGRLVTIGEHGDFAGISLDILNDVHAYLGDGLYHNGDAVHDPTDNLGGTAYWPIIHTFSSDAVNAGVGEVVQLLGSSLRLSGPAFGTAFGDEDTYIATVTPESKAGSGASGGVGLAYVAKPNGSDTGTAEPIVVQAMAQIGVGTVFAIGDANLWDRVDWLGDGRMSIYRYDNAQLAHNVFASGDWCGHCPVALFKDHDPWEWGLAHDADSSPTGPTVATADEALLDAAGDLPPGTAFAPVAPMALGDVVNSFAAPDAGFLGLEWVDGFLWVSSDTGSLYRLAPSDGTILETIPLPSSMTSCGLAWDGDSFWVADCDAHEIVQLSPAGAMESSFPSPSLGPVGLAWDGTHLWDVDWTVEELHRIDSATGTVVRTIPAPDTRAAGLAWDGRSLWTNGRDSAQTYKLDPLDGSVEASFATPPGPGANNGRGGAFDGQYLWITNKDSLMIYQVDVEHLPTYIDPNEEILQAWNIPYDVWGARDIGAVDLAPYCRVIVASAQEYNLYEAISSRRAWLEPWIAAGGVLEFHGATIMGQDWSGLPMPGGFSTVWATRDDVAAINTRHPILTWPNAITNEELDDWDASTHGYLVDLPSATKTVIAIEDSGEPTTVEFAIDRGCVLATAQPLEWAWIRDLSPILENVILSGCTPWHVYLPLVLRNSP